VSERILRLSGADSEPALLVRSLAGAGAPVLYVHGATFPSALSVAYRFGDRSWMDDLVAHGFDAWAFDFAGFGGSDRYSKMNVGREGVPLGRAPDAAAQIARVVEHIVDVTGVARVSIIAHSWGTIAAGLYAAAHRERVERLCLFGPIAQRALPGLADPQSIGSWRLVTVAEQLARFVEDVPHGHASVLIEPDLTRWGDAYLDSDPTSRERDPVSVKIPAGPQADILAAWSGNFGYQPRDIIVPTLIVRGEWDSVSNGRDADWLLSRVESSVRKEVVLPKGTHLAHLEHARDGLFLAVREFLGGSK
jgi:pimeloyl-ACP methyl ester carboxylesterase